MYIFTIIIKTLLFVEAARFFPERLRDKDFLFKVLSLIYVELDLVVSGVDMEIYIL
jgi:hypothetical protein